MEKQSLKSIVPWSGWMALVMFVSFFVWIIWIPGPIHQPLSFNHAMHEEFGCVTCHEGIETQIRASLPEFTLCMMCHDEPPVSDPIEMITCNQAVETENIQWN